MTLLTHFPPVLRRRKMQSGAFISGVIATAMVAGMVGAERSAQAAEAASSPQKPNFQDRLNKYGSNEGGGARIVGMPIREISLREVIDAVISRNLDVLMAGEVIGAAQSVVTQSDAVFDPTIFSSLSYTNRFYVKRKETFGRFYDVTQDSIEQAQQQENQANEIFNKSPPQNMVCQINGEEIPGGSILIGNQNNSDNQCFKSPQWIYAQEYAIDDSLSDHKIVGSIGLGKQFLFGPTVQLTFSTMWHKKGYASQSGSPALASGYYPDDLSYNPYGWSGKLFWTSNATLALSLPLPFTKGFGEEGNVYAYSLSLSEQNLKRATYSEKSQRNQRLSESLQAYWDLVRIANNIGIRSELKIILMNRFNGQKKLLESGLVTNYDLNQVEAQLLNLDLSEENDWNQLISLSNRLLTLLASSQRALLIPSDAESALTTGIYQGGLGRTRSRDDPSAAKENEVGTPQTIALQYATVAANNDRQTHNSVPAGVSGDILNSVLENHPDIKLQEQNYEISKTTLNYQINQNLPDVSLSATAGINQSDSVFGYGTIGQSWENLIHPDTVNFTVLVRYRYPLWNHAAEAAASRARIQERQAWNQVRDTRQSVTIAIDRATAELKSAQTQVRQGNDDVSLAQFAFDRSKEQRDLGLISEFEVLNRYSALLSARLNRCTAQANVQKAYVRLLAAQGILESGYGH